MELEDRLAFSLCHAAFSRHDKWDDTNAVPFKDRYELTNMDLKDHTSDLFPLHLRPARLDFFPCVVAFAPQLILLEVKVIQLMHP
jgi:hypothetical protein